MGIELWFFYECAQALFDRVCDITARLSRDGISVPKILASDPDNLLLLIEDLGDVHLADLLRDGQPAQPLLLSAIDALMLVRRCNTRDLPVMDTQTLHQMTELVTKWYPGANGEALSRLRNNLRQHLLTLEDTPLSFSLRDFHVENILWKDGKIGLIGANLKDQVAMELVRHGPIDSLLIGADRTIDMSLFSLRMFGKMITGDLSLSNLSGPVTIAGIAGDTARVGWFAYISFLALISISLGVLNLLPIPVLDGGHLVYYAIEAIRGKPLSDRVMEFTQKVGVGMIMVMMSVALFNDMVRLFTS